MKKKKGSGLKENYKHDRMSCRQSKQFLFSFHQKRKDALGNATYKQVGSAKISRKPLEHSCLFEAKQLEEYFFKLYYMKINRIFLLPFIRSANIYSTVTVADSAGCSGITNIVPSLVELGSLTCFSVAGYAWERTVLKYFLEEETFKKILRPYQINKEQTTSTQYIFSFLFLLLPPLLFHSHFIFWINSCWPPPKQW